MTIKHLLDQSAFLKKPPIWLWIALSPSFVVDAVLIYRLIDKVITTNTYMTPTFTGLLGNFLLMLLFNAVFFKSVPFIILLLQRSLLKQSYVLIKPDEVIFYKRLWVGYEFDYGFTHFYEYHLSSIKKIQKRCDGSLVVFGKILVYCFQDDGSQTMDFVGNDLQSKKLARNRCVIPGVFEGMDEIQLKLEQLKDQRI